MHIKVFKYCFFILAYIIFNLGNTCKEIKSRSHSLFKKYLKKEDKSNMTKLFIFPIVL